MSLVAIGFNLSAQLRVSHDCSRTRIGHLGIADGAPTSDQQLNNGQSEVRSPHGAAERHHPDPAENGQSIYDATLNTSMRYDFACPAAQPRELGEKVVLFDAVGAFKKAGQEIQRTDGAGSSCTVGKPRQVQH